MFSYCLAKASASISSYLFLLSYSPRYRFSDSLFILYSFSLSSSSCWFLSSSSFWIISFSLAYIYLILFISSFLFNYYRANSSCWIFSLSIYRFFCSFLTCCSSSSCFWIKSYEVLACYSSTRSLCSSAALLCLSTSFNAYCSWIYRFFSFWYKSNFLLSSSSRRSSALLNFSFD